MEHTNIIRIPINNLHDYVYICPNNCFGDTDLSLYNPIIERINKDTNNIYLNDTNIYTFYVANSELLYLELSELYLLEVNNDTILKIEFIKYSIVTRFLDINEIYRKILNYMKVKEDFNTCFNKSNIVLLNKSIDKLKYRIGHGYYTNNIFSSFIKSTEYDLDNYVKNKIQSILINCLYLEQNHVLNYDDTYVEKIVFSDDTELKKIIDHYSIVFKDMIDKINN
jgi:hypothetical protein